MAILKDVDKRLSGAVSHYWQTRTAQAEKQGASGQKDQGFRSAVTGGAQMDGFSEFVEDLILEAGLSKESVFRKKALELPGYFRPTKEWDILAVDNGQLVLAVELKSQVGPSFGNNFNNRTEEAMGSALDLWTAFREGTFRSATRPWLGYFFLLEDCPKSRTPVRVTEPHFAVFPEFKDASYAQRYEHFCRRIVLEGHYTVASFLMADAAGVEEADIRNRHPTCGLSRLLNHFLPMLRRTQERSSSYDFR
ncbi:MAG: PaeR7I family type II restriction endonuclease [Candidatus Zixiibacteriota bacterium]